MYWIDYFITHLLVQILVYISGNSLVGSEIAPLRAPMARVGWYGIPPAPGLWVVERLAERVGEGLELVLRGKRLASVASSFLYFSASASMRSISSFERRPLLLVIVMRLDLPEVLSVPETLRRPLVLMSKMTST